MPTQAETATINIDLTPYEVAIEKGRHMAVLDCGGSVLSNLNNAFEVTGDRFSGDANQVVMDTEDGGIREYTVEYHTDDINGDTCYFTPEDGGKPNTDELVDWISQNYDRMEEIAYATLLTDDEVESVFQRHNALESGPSF